MQRTWVRPSRRLLDLYDPTWVGGKGFLSVTALAVLDSPCTRGWPLTHREASQVLGLKKWATTAGERIFLRNYLNQIVLWACLWGLSWELIEVGSLDSELCESQEGQGRLNSCNKLCWHAAFSVLLTGHAMSSCLKPLSLMSLQLWTITLNSKPNKLLSSLRGIRSEYFITVAEMKIQQTLKEDSVSKQN